MLCAGEADVELVRVKRSGVHEMRDSCVDLQGDVCSKTGIWSGIVHFIIVLDERDLVLGSIVDDLDDPGIVGPVCAIEQNADALRGGRGKQVVGKPLDEGDFTAGLAEGTQLR